MGFWFGFGLSLGFVLALGFRVRVNSACIVCMVEAMFSYNEMFSILGNVADAGRVRWVRVSVGVRVRVRVRVRVSIHTLYPSPLCSHLLLRRSFNGCMAANKDMVLFNPTVDKYHLKIRRWYRNLHRAEKISKSVEFLST